MKCKPLALRVLSTAAMMSIVASCAAPAFAATYDLTTGDVSVSAESDGKQYVSQWTDDAHTKYASDDGGEINHREDNNVTLTSHNKETKNTITVSADEGQEAKVTLNDVNIDTRDNQSDKDSDDYKNSTGDAAMTVTGKGDVTVELDGKNALTSGVSYAGLQKNSTDSTGTLTIQDETGTAGSLSATGGAFGAGIGGSYDSDTGAGHGTENIAITGGEITATGGNYYYNGNPTYYGGAGIGGSINSKSSATSDDHLDVSNITISGGKVTATGGVGSAGIGGGNNYLLGSSSYDNLPEVNVKDITISGGEIHAKGGNIAAGIGGGYCSMGDVSGIHISGVSNSTVEGGYLAAAIGGGSYEPGYVASGIITPKGTVDDIKISNSQLTINPGFGGTGIGTGFGPTLADDAVSITDKSDITIKKIYNFPIPNYTEWPDSSYIGVGGHFEISSTASANTVDGSETDVSAICSSKITYLDAVDGTEKVEKTIISENHTWGEWETVKEATTTETGLRQRTCSVCGKVEQEELPVLTPEVPDTPVTPDAPETENTSTPELRVVAPDTIPQTFSVTQSGTVRTYTSPYNSGTLTGTMETLEYLQEQGAETIVFTTNQRTSRFAVADLLALVNEGDVFYLSHMDANEPTLLVVANDHTDLLG